LKSLHMSRESIPETHMLFVGEEFYCFWSCENKRVNAWKRSTEREFVLLFYIQEINRATKIM
jgi:hypothetical protein